MTATVYASPELKTLTALKRRLRKSWRSISLTTVQNLISSLPARLKAVIRNKRDTSETNETPFCTNICMLAVLKERCVLSRYCAIFGVTTLLSIMIVADQLSA